MGVRAGQSRLCGSEQSVAAAESRTTLCQLLSPLMSRSNRQQQSEPICVLYDVCRGLTQSVYTTDGRILELRPDRHVALPVQAMLYHTSLRQRC
jgi:hypothetical protein